MDLFRISRSLAEYLDRMEFGLPVTHVYNPLTYAWDNFHEYLTRFGRGPKDVLIMGMNPGPWGMAQTGIPFGEITFVRDWLGLNHPVGQPANAHPQRPVVGMACARSEMSGLKVWSWVKSRFGTPDAFSTAHLIINYCPLAFFEADGTNRTPDKLQKKERELLFASCDLALRQTVQCLRPRLIVGLGRFAEQRIAASLTGITVQQRMVPHPSPANPRSRTGWEVAMDQAVRL